MEKDNFKSQNAVLEVRSTRNKGRGVFTLSKIKKHSVIEVCPVLLFNAKEGKSHLLNHYAFRWDKKRIALALGKGSLYNHSSDPNIAPIQDKKDKQIVFVSLTDIDKGEELVFRYSDCVWFKEKT